MFITEDPVLHRHRREPVSNFFSKRNIRNLEPMLQEKVQFLMGRVRAEFERDAVLNLSDMNSALTLDVISAYSFGHGWKQLENPEYGKLMRRTLMDGSAANNWGRQFPYIFNVYGFLIFV
jgi:cytochrome P450